MLCDSLTYEPSHDHQSLWGHCHLIPTYTNLGASDNTDHLALLRLSETLFHGLILRTTIFTSIMILGKFFWAIGLFFSILGKTCWLLGIFYYYFMPETRPFLPHSGQDVSVVFLSALIETQTAYIWP